jgi:DNA-3-methyladenine glycosylase
VSGAASQLPLEKSERSTWRLVPRSFFARDARLVAADLIGCLFAIDGSESGDDSDGPCGGVVIETEAYRAHGDDGSHSRSGPTARNRAMFGRAGHAYVYRIYGLHHCFNVVTGAVGSGEAVLIRALEPRFGLEHMRTRRGRGDALCTGPARLVEALALGAHHDGADLLAAPFVVLRPREPLPAHAVVVDRRIGLTRGAELALRFRRRER